MTDTTDYQNQAGGSGDQKPHLKYPGNILTADELEILREMAAELRRQRALLSSKGEEFEERLALARMPLRCKECAAIWSCPEWKFLPKYRSTALYPEDLRADSRHNIPPGEHGGIVSDCLNRLGPRGRSGDNPIDAIVWDLRELQDKIEMLTHTGILRTIDVVTLRRTSFRLSDDGKLHATIDIPIGTNDIPPSPVALFGIPEEEDPEEPRLCGGPQDCQGSDCNTSGRSDGRLSGTA